MPTVSVIIPTYNRPEYVKRAVESVMAQTYGDWELIVVDDGCPTGRISKIIQSYQEKDRRIRCVRQPNGGVNRARNTGIRMSFGKYVAFLDDDDQWAPEKLQKQVHFMELHPEIGLCYARLAIVRFTNGTKDDSKTLPKGLATGFEELLYGDWIATSTFMIRRSCLDSVDWFDPRYPIAQDYDLLIRFVQKWKVGALPDALAFTVKDDRARSSTDLVKSSINAMEVLQNLELTADYAQYRPLVHRHIARIEYILAREYAEGGKYFPAAIHFLKSLAIFPLVGTFFRRKDESDLQLAIRIVKTYAAVPYCFLKGLIHGR